VLPSQLTLEHLEREIHVFLTQVGDVCFSLLRTGTVGPSKGTMQTAAYSVPMLFCPDLRNVGGGDGYYAGAQAEFPQEDLLASTILKSSALCWWWAHTGDTVSHASSSAARWGLYSRVHNNAPITFIKGRSPECRS